MRRFWAVLTQRTFGGLWGRLAVLAVAVFGLMLLSALVLVGPMRTSLGEALWWSFLHLVDPSRLAADRGVARRILGVILTVAGLVIVFGTVLAILTEAFDRSLRRLGRLDVPVRASGHLVIVGWHPAMVRLLAAYSLLVSRFGRFYGLPTRLVVVAPDSARDERDEILRMARRAAAGLRVDVVFGDADDADRLERASVATARDVVVWTAPALDRHPRELDVETLRAASEVAKSLARSAVVDDSDAAPAPAPAPTVRAAFVWGENADAAETVIGTRSDLLVADRVLAALETRFLVDPPWAVAIGELLEADGQRILLSRPFAERVPQGATFGDLPRLLDSIPLGLVRVAADGTRRLRIAPAAATPLAPSDRMIFVDSFESEPAGRSERGAAFTPVRAEVAALTVPPPAELEMRPLRLLVLGWDHQVVTLLDEMASYPAGTFSLVSVSASAEAARAAEVRSAAQAVPVRYRTQSLADLAALEAVFDAELPDAVLIGADWHQRGDMLPDLSEATAVLNSLLAQRAATGRELPLMVSPRRTADGELLQRGHGTFVLPTVNEILRRLILQSLLHPGLGAVLDAIFDPDVVRGRTIEFCPDDAAPHPFGAVWRAMLGHAAVPLGVVRPDGSVRLHPSFDDLLAPGDRLLVLRWAAEGDWEDLPG